MENQEQQIQQQNKEKKGKKSILLLVLLLLLVTVTIGYAVLSASFNIHGESTIAHGDWCLDPRGCGDDRCTDIETCDDSPITYPEDEPVILTDCDANPDKCNCTGTECSGPDPIDCTVNPEKCTAPNCTITATETCACTGDKTKCIVDPQIWMKGNTVYFTHTLTKPGDVFTFDAKFKNDGDLDAVLKTVTKSELNATAKQFLDYTVKYVDGSTVTANDALNAGSSATFRVTVSYKDTVTTPPTAAQLALINETADGNSGATSLFTVEYEQKQ